MIQTYVVKHEGKPKVENEHGISEPKQPRVTALGLISYVNNSMSYEIEYCTKTLCNLLAAISRQLSARCTVLQKDIVSFERFCARKWEELYDQMDFSLYKFQTIEEYISKFIDPTKRQMYGEIIEAQLYDKMKINTTFVGEAMVKSGEVYAT